MGKFVGREDVCAVLKRALTSGDPELIAVYGRRRVGKTFLIREYFADQLRLEITGALNASIQQQLKNFAKALAAAAAGGRKKWDVPATWSDAFQQLEQYLTSLGTSRKQVIFIDELPWFASRGSGFLSALDHWWNTRGTRRKNLIVVVCGSAASWMVKNVVHNRGGLHNRLTRRIRLEPFTLAETLQFLRSRRVELGLRHIVELYMAMGGIPHYLKEVDGGLSAAQNIDQLCFSPTGLLRDEFQRLYSSLFDHSERHIRVVRAMSQLRRGLTRNEVLAAAEVATGGTVTALLDELVEAGFVARVSPFEKGKKDTLYRLADEYSLFYLNWIESHRGVPKNTWLAKSKTPSWRAWSGYAFESVCMKHLPQIRQALGIAGIETNESAWTYRPTSRKSNGAQIDLLIDRADGCINVCEMKFSEGEFVIDKAYAAELNRKLSTFREMTSTRKTLFLTLVTAGGLKDNQYRRELVTHTVPLEKLFVEV